MAASLSISAIVSFSIALSVLASACPAQYSLSMFNDGTLIYICRSNNRSFWYETKDTCESLKIEPSSANSQERGISNWESLQVQWRLPKVDSLENNQRLFEIIKQSNISSFFFFWIGLKRNRDNDGTDWKDPSKWMWSNDNTTLEESFRAETVPWKDIDPKTSSNEPTSEFCVLAANLNASESIVWYRSKCDGSDMSVDELVPLLICEGIAKELDTTSTKSATSSASEVNTTSNVQRPNGAVPEVECPTSDEPTDQWEKWKYVLLGFAITLVVIGVAAFIALLFIFCPLHPRKKFEAQHTDSGAAESGSGSGIGGDTAERHCGTSDTADGSGSGMAPNSKPKSKNSAGTKTLRPERVDPSKSDDQLSGMDASKSGGWSTTGVMLEE